MRNRIYKYFLLSFLIVVGGIIYFVMLRSNQIVIKSAAAESREADAKNEVVFASVEEREKAVYQAVQPGRLSGEGKGQENKAKADVQSKSGPSEDGDPAALSEADPVAVTLPVKSEAAEPESEDKEKVKKVNINTAGKAELMTLKGIGEKKAELIIRDRQERGVFHRIEDIMRIKGIKRKAFQKIKDQITVSDE